MANVELSIAAPRKKPEFSNCSRAQAPLAEKCAKPVRLLPVVAGIGDPGSDLRHAIARCLASATNGCLLAKLFRTFYRQSCSDLPPFKKKAVASSRCSLTADNH